MFRYGKSACYYSMWAFILLALVKYVCLINSVYQWIVSNTPLCNTCPVCKSAVDKDKLIPIYTRGKNVDPRY